MRYKEKGMIGPSVHGKEEEQQQRQAARNICDGRDLSSTFHKEEEHRKTMPTNGSFFEKINVTRHHYRSVLLEMIYCLVRRKLEYNFGVTNDDV
jgi:hypothetical protein